MSRCVQLANKLRERLSKYDPAAPEAFAASCEAEARELCSASYGGVILESVGSAYEHAALEAMGGLQGMREGWREWGRNIGRYYTAASSVAKVMKMQQELEQRAKEREKERAKRAPAQQGGDGTDDAAAAVAADAADAAARLAEDAEMQRTAMPTILGALWSANNIDIHKT
jgi:hypothetical protein